MSSGCGCKEVYRFPHITYPYSSSICSFLQQHPYFLFIFKMFFVLVPVYFCNLFNNFFAQYKQIYGRLQASHGSRMNGCTYCFIREKAHTKVHFISCDGHQLYAFKECGVDLEVEGMRYIEMHHGPHMYWARLLQGAEIST